jgi:hypothetical protein
MESEDRPGWSSWLERRAPLLLAAGMLFLAVAVLIVVETLTGA